MRVQLLLFFASYLSCGLVAEATPKSKSCGRDLGQSESAAQIHFDELLIGGLRGYLSQSAAISFPGLGSVVFTSWDESTGKSLERYALKLDAANLRAFKSGCGKALGQLDLLKALDLEIALVLLEVAERLDATEFIEALSEIRFPSQPNAQVLHFMRQAQGFARRAAEAAPNVASAKFLRRIVDLPEYRDESPAGWLILGLTYAEPEKFRSTFSLLRNSLERKYGARGGDWIIDHLREAGIDESVVRTPGPSTPVWWARMVGEAKSTLDIDLSFQSRVRNRGRDLDDFEKAWNAVYSKLPENIVASLVGGTEQLGFKDTLEFTIYYKAEHGAEPPVKTEKFRGDPYVRRHQLIMPWWFRDHLVLTQRKL